VYTTLYFLAGFSLISAFKIAADLQPKTAISKKSKTLRKILKEIEVVTERRKK